MHLLYAAGFIQLNHSQREWIVKIAGRIVEGEVAVFTDSQQRYVKPIRRQQGSVADAFGSRVFSLAADRMENSGSHSIQKVLAKIAAERIRRNLARARIFVEMIRGHAFPINIWLCGQGCKGLVLRGSGGKYYCGCPFGS